MYQYILKLPIKIRLYTKIGKTSDSKEDVYLFQHYFFSPIFLVNLCLLCGFWNRVRNSCVERNC